MNTIQAGAPARDPRLDPPPGLLVRIVARLASWLLPPRREGLAQDRPLRILVVRPDDRVGNALLTIPLARALAQALPGAEIDLLLSSARASVARGLPGIGLVEFDKRDGFRRPLRLPHFIRFLQMLRARRYDAAIDGSHWHAFSLTSALLARWSAPFVVGSDRGPTCLYSRALPLPPQGRQEVAAKLALAAGLGLPETALPLPLPPLETTLGRTPAALESARSARAALGITGPFALLNPGARKADHRWDANQFAALARALREQHGLRSLVFWGPGEEALAKQVCAASEGAALFGPPTDLDALAAHLRQCALAVTNDTGPMHLAAACGAPLLAIFLAADGERWAHDGPRFARVDARSGTSAAAQLDAAKASAAQLLALTRSGSHESLPT